MSTIEKNQRKNLVNKSIECIRRIDVSTLIKIARILNIPVQTNLIKKYEVKDENL
jgi:hypothetical protein